MKEFFYHCCSNWSHWAAWPLMMLACLFVAELIVRSGIFHMIGRAIGFLLIGIPYAIYRTLGGKGDDWR